ncbi:GNAT family N-acetyltransferase, partial [bacterium]|nr:GNAT family N-acetyltransferase [bacterium]
SYRIVAGAAGHQVGSVMVHDRGDAAIEVTDLGVNRNHRKHGVGGDLMASAFRAGLQLGKSKVSLASQDDGSGRLTNWYKSMGFKQVGVNKFGYPQLEAPISRALSGVAQVRMASPPLHQSSATAGIASKSQRAASGGIGQAQFSESYGAKPFPSKVVQRMEEQKEQEVEEPDLEEEDTMGWPETINFANVKFSRCVRNGNVYYQIKPRQRATEVYVSIHNPGKHFLKWDGELWCKAHSTRNKFISVKFFRGEVSDPGLYSWVPDEQYRKSTDPDSQEEYEKQYRRACAVGVGLTTRLKIKQAEALETYVSSFE